MPRFSSSVQSLEPRMLLSGDLDPSFGNGGVATDQVPAGSMDDVYVLQQTDGKILLAGCEADSSGRVFIDRLNSDGSPDLSFGLAGRFENHLGKTGRNLLDGIELGPDGKILAVEVYATQSSASKLAVIRLNLDGTLDTSFGTGGVVRSGLTGSGWGGDDLLAVRPDGRILIEGIANPGHVEIMQLNPDGTTDNNFGVRGHAAVAGTTVPTGMRLASDGKVLALAGDGADGTGAHLSRLTSDGQLDGSFAGTGSVSVSPGSWPASARELAIAPSGETYVGGQYYTYYPGWTTFVQAYDESGATVSDDSFTPLAPTGVLVFVNALAVQSDGALLVQCFEGGGSGHLWLQRYYPQGAIDCSWGQNCATIVQDQDPNSAADMSLQSDGKVLIASVAGGTEQGQIHVMRRLAQGFVGPDGSALVADDNILTLTGTAGNDSIFAGHAEGQFVVQVNGHADVFDSTKIRGIVINALPGDDRIWVSDDTMIPCTIYGGDGADTITGGGGDDSIVGGSGPSLISGGGGNDTIMGGPAADTIFGNAGDDSINGGAGWDWIRGGQGNDTISGGAGNDILLGASGRDLVYGGRGDDTIAGGAGQDTLIGGAGTNLVLARDGEMDFIDPASFFYAQTDFNDLLWVTSDNIF